MNISTWAVALLQLAVLCCIVAAEGWRVGTGSRVIIPPVNGNTDYVVRAAVRQNFIKATLCYPLRKSAVSCPASVRLL